SRRYEPAAIARDTGVKAGLQAQGLEAKSFNGSLLFEPWNVETKSGGPYKVFTPFWNMLQTLPPPREPLPAPRKLKRPSTWPESMSVDELKLKPTRDWDAGIESDWTPGEAGALAELDRFLDHALIGYSDGRDRPAMRGTSRMSPYLHFGEISPNTIWYNVHEHAQSTGGAGTITAATSYLREIAWREFAHHLLYHFPQTPDAPLKAVYENFPWNERPGQLAAWQQGMTGYPIVDAGLRELWHTGWMHNRVRMIVASFLIKDLLIDWRKGAAWFWDTLVDADLANNTMGWQWTAGCGADASPFFRVFNPMSQGEKFDPNGDYARKWCPELSDLPNKWIYRPFEAPAEILSAAGVTLGKHYPKPIVNHKVAREKALAALAEMKLA
ncbi:MAG: deoxyribodipyrimidine photo-lyase, partial [Verrucomicrobiales bacterium]